MVSYSVITTHFNMKIPGDNRWTQTNEGDKFGVLHDTQNIATDLPGSLKLSKKGFSLYTSDDDVDLAYILALPYFNNSYVAVTDDELFTFDINAGNVAQIGSSPVTTLATDAQVFNSRLYVTLGGNLDYWTGSAWGGNQKTLTSGVPHPMCVYEDANNLAIGNGNTVLILDTSHTTLLTVTFPAQYQVTTLKYRNGFIYAGTKHLNGGDAKVFVFDNQDTGSEYEINTGSNWVFSMTEYGNSVVFVTEKGQLLHAQGSSAVPLGAFPVYHDPDAIWQGSGGLSLNGKVMHRGMATVGDTIYINIDGSLASGFLPEMKSGLWVFDPAVGLTHRASHSVDRYVEDSGITATSSVITTTSAHNLKSGDCVQFGTVSGLTGVDNAVKYYVDVQSTTTLKLCLSRKALANGNYVEIAGTATTDSLIYVPNTDWRAGFGGAQGAIALTTPLEAQLLMWESPVVWGSRIEDLDGNTVYSINGLTDSFNIGSCSTQRIYSDQIEQTWQEVYAFIDGVHNSVEEIVLKVKDGNKVGYPTNVYRGVWGSANTIHSVNTTYDEDEWDDIEKGDEINIVDGYGRGYSCHVVTKETGGTFVLTLDESIGTAEKPVYFYVDSFRKVAKVGNGRREDYIKASDLKSKKSWIKLKAEMRGFGTELSHFDLSNTVHKKRSG